MQKNKLITLTAFAMVLFLFYTAATVHAINQINVNPEIINPGQHTTITLSTGKPATGNLSVKDPNGNIWASTIPINIPGATGGTQSWDYFTDFEEGANTNTPGSYDVIANVTIDLDTIEWTTEFKIEFFVIPDLPLGTLMAVVACFGAVISYKKLRQ